LARPHLAHHRPADELVARLRDRARGRVAQPPHLLRRKVEGVLHGRIFYFRRSCGLLWRVNRIARPSVPISNTTSSPRVSSLRILRKVFSPVLLRRIRSRTGSAVGSESRATPPSH